MGNFMSLATTLVLIDGAIASHSQGFQQNTLHTTVGRVLTLGRGDRLLGFGSSIVRPTAFNAGVVPESTLQVAMQEALAGTTQASCEETATVFL